ncbi:succinylglutamate desuccinylase/aspartoacylase family protein [Rhodobacterales bacterium]|nr:succinylglutamate desuccinylase/aspartoacylase family protein [Rhodobacterales bacterium]
MSKDVKPFQIGEWSISPGTRRTVDLPVSMLSDHTPVSMSVHVLHGRKPGPVLFVSAAVHGDEVIGVEIARRVLKAPQLEAQELEKLKGTLLVIPIVNAFGFLNHSRYLPDRRDLNRSFPGSQRGSLAGRLAHLFMTEIVARSNYGIDLHSAAIHRTNLPQIRVSPSRTETMLLAKAFGAPVIMTSKIREGSLRAAAHLKDADVLVFEGGEGLRFDEMTIRAGVSGVLRVMRELKMVGAKGITRPSVRSIISMTSYWVRSPAGGLLRPFKSVGEVVEPEMLLGIVSDPFGENERNVLTEKGGLIVGRTNLPVINEGDGLFHIAEFNERYDAEQTLDSLSSQLEADPLFDEDEII